jgi:beta-glucosidase
MATRKAFTAGVDMDMVSSLYHDHLQDVVKSGAATHPQLDDAVRHVLRVKLALGLFEHPYVDEAAAAKALFHPESIALAQTAAEKSFVLLKNGNGANGKPLLPLTSAGQNIAVIGPLSDDSWYPNGTSGGGPRVSLVAALTQHVGEGHVSRFQGGTILGGSDADIVEAVAGAQKADVVIAAMGEAPDMSGEAASRAHLGLPGRQQELLEAVVKTGKPVVLVLFSGRPLTLPWAFEHVPAVIEAWQPGLAAGPALARTIFGEVNPSGKLTVSWPRSVGQEPLYYNSLNTGRPSRDVDLTHPPADIVARYVSRYIDEQNAPQFPFGYGSSYTTYSYGKTSISKNSLSAAALNKNLNGQSALTADADVTNTGSRAGEEVVQLYVQLRGTSLTQPVRALKGFQTVSLAPGETKKVHFELKPEALVVWTDHNQFAAEAAKLQVWISPDSAHGTAAQAEILP